MKGAEAKKYHTLLLDVDGTLLDFHASERQGISRILMDYGFPASDELLEKYHQINDGYWQAFNRGEISKERLCRERFVRFFGELGLSVDGEDAEKSYRTFLDGSAILLPGALETCRKLSGKYDCYVVTNGTSQTQYRRLALSGLDVLMKDIFVSEDAGSQKPQKAYFDSGRYRYLLGESGRAAGAGRDPGGLPDPKDRGASGDSVICFLSVGGFFQRF